MIPQTLGPSVGAFIYYYYFFFFFLFVFFFVGGGGIYICTYIYIYLDPNLRILQDNGVCKSNIEA